MCCSPCCWKELVRTERLHWTDTWNLKYDTNEANYRNWNRLMDTENRLNLAKRKCVGGAMDWKVGISRCNLLYIEWINNKVLLYSTGNYIQYPMINHSGKKKFKNQCVCVCVYIKSNHFALYQKLTQYCKSIKLPLKKIEYTLWSKVDGNSKPSSITYYLKGLGKLLESLNFLTSRRGK